MICSRFAGTAPPRVNAWTKGGTMAFRVVPQQPAFSPGEESMEYRCVATSVEGFVQQLAVAYVQHGYWFYVAGWIPGRKDAEAVDRKLIDQYGIGISKWARARRKQQGLANLHYL